MNNTLQQLARVPQEHRLLLGDWVSKLRAIPDSSVDFVCIDPPYGVTENKWDKSGGLTYLYPALKRVCKPDACIAVFAAHTFLAELLSLGGFSNSLRYKYVWCKTKATGHLNAKKQPMRQHEDILIFKTWKNALFFNAQKTPPTKPPQKKQRQGRFSTNYNHGNKDRMFTPHQYTDDGSRYMTDVLNFTQAKDRGLHPTQKPVDLLRHLIRSHCPEGGTVLDCFAGSGSTAIATIREGRKVIAIERDIKYFRTIVNRVLAEG